MSNASILQNPALPLPQNVWQHGVLMLILLLLLNIALTALWMCAVFQFVWMLFAKTRNIHVAGFGAQVGNWMAISTGFVSGSSDQKPFPWTAWS